MRHLRNSVLFSLPMAMIGAWAQDCSADVAGPDRTIETVYTSSNCGSSSSFRAGRKIGNPSELRTIWKAITAGQFPEQAVPPVDFKKRSAILIGVGAKPHSGYGLELVDTTGKLSRGVFHLSFRENKPSPDGVYAQVVVTPCVIVSIDRSIKRFKIDYEVARARN